jgi:carbon monoxide dehydrogenase subunit G
MECKISTTINASKEKVWSVISDLDNEPKYWHGTKSVKNLSVNDNEIVREVIIAFKNSRCKEIVRLEPKSKIYINIIEGPMKGHKIITLSNDNNITKVDVTWDIKLSGMLSIFSSIVKGHIEDGTKEALERIKIECETN